MMQTEDVDGDKISVRTDRLHFRLFSDGILTFNLLPCCKYQSETINIARDVHLKTCCTPIEAFRQE